MLVEAKLADRELSKSRLAVQKLPENRHGDRQPKGKRNHCETRRGRTSAFAAPAWMPGE